MAVLPDCGVRKGTNTIKAIPFQCCHSIRGIAFFRYTYRTYRQKTVFAPDYLLKSSYIEISLC